MNLTDGRLHINLSQSGIDKVISSPTGPVQTFMRRTAERTADEARRRAPVQTGRLRSSITVNRAALGAWEVTANVDYAFIVHQGKKKKNKTTVRRGKGGMKVAVRKKSGSGKGAKGQPFLRDALKDVVGSLG